jgi:hypothetical protein
VKLTTRPESADAVEEIDRAFQKYKSGLGCRNIIIPKLWNDAAERHLQVSDTLFSGETPTQAVNTYWIGSAAMVATAFLMSLSLLAWIKLFFKGDDLNAFVPTWLHAWLFLVIIEQAGFILEPSKDHIEYGQCEHERCIVTARRYNGTKARRIGAMVASEPQGAQGLTLNELLDSANEARMSLLSRGVNGRLVDAFFEATITTYYNKPTVGKSLFRACCVPPCSGGYGLWSEGFYYVNSAKPPPVVVTEFKLNRRGKLSKYGTAAMTDPMLARIAREHDVPVARLLPVRERMIGDSFIGTLGPRAKYGSRARANRELSLKIVTGTKFQHFEIDFNDNVKRLATEAANELRRWLADPEVLSAKVMVTPGDIVKAAISRSGCLNAEIYKLIHGIAGDAAMIELAISGQKPPHERDVVWGMSYKAHAARDLLYLDGVRVVFNRKHDAINAEVMAYVRKFALWQVGKCCLPLETISRKQLAVANEWECICVRVAREVWDVNKDHLSRIAY